MALESTTITHLILRSASIAVQETTDMGRGIVATRDIKAGSVLTIEHVLFDKLDGSTTFDTVKALAPLHSNLAPRDDTSVGDESVVHKLVSNCFGFCPTHSGGTKEGYLLGLATSLFNHSATPNCKHTVHWVKFPTIDTIPGFSTYVMSVVAVLPIAQGDPLTITYRAPLSDGKTNSLFPFITTAAPPPKIPEDVLKHGSKEMVLRILHYTRSTTFLEILTVQYLARRGAVVVGGDVLKFATTPPVFVMTPGAINHYGSKIERKQILSDLLTFVASYLPTACANINLSTFTA